MVTVFIEIYKTACMDEITNKSKELSQKGRDTNNNSNKETRSWLRKAEMSNISRSSIKKESSELGEIFWRKKQSIP